MTAVTTYGIELSVELGIGQSALAGHWGAGTWGAALWGTSDTSLGDWVDVTCDCLDGLGLSASANTDEGVTRRWESASASFTLDGAKYDPWSGMYAGILGDRTPVRIRWRPYGAPNWNPAFTGYITGRGYSWNADEQQGSVSCVDGTSILVASDGVPQPPTGAGDTAAQRVTRIATTALWPDTLDVTPGGTQLQATTLDAVAWDELLNVADTDLGLLWVSRAGALTYRPRGRVGHFLRPQSTRLVVCAEGPGDVEVMTMSRPQASVNRNRVTIARRADPTIANDAPVPAFLESRQSVARYQAHAYSRTDLLHRDDDWSETVAQAVLGAGAFPSSAPGSVLLDSISGDSRIPAILLGLEPDMTFAVVDTAGQTWIESVVAWQVTVFYAEIEGGLQVEDVSRWVQAGTWGTSHWGADRWGIGNA